MNYSSPRSSRSGAHPKDDAADGGTAQGATPAAEQNAADPGSPHARADAPRACGAAAHESHALAPRRRQMPAVKPEVIIEIPPACQQGAAICLAGRGGGPLDHHRDCALGAGDSLSARIQHGARGNCGGAGRYASGGRATPSTCGQRCVGGNCGGACRDTPGGRAGCSIAAAADSCDWSG